VSGAVLTEVQSTTPLKLRNTHLLLVGHAPLAGGFKAMAVHAFPDCGLDVTAVDIAAESSTDEACDQLSQALSKLEQPLLALVDVWGATPANALEQALKVRPDVALVSGLNLAMLWRALGYRHQPPATLAELAIEGGLRGIQGRSMSTELNPADRC
jgi:mannose PTS system EIIA component